MVLYVMFFFYLLRSIKKKKLFNFFCFWTERREGLFEERESGKFLRCFGANALVKTPKATEIGERMNAKK